MDMTYPAMGTGNSDPAGTINSDPTCWFIDWSATRGVAYARGSSPDTPLETASIEPAKIFTNDAGHRYGRHALLVFIQTVPVPGDVVCLESTFDNFDPELRDQVIKVAAARGVRLACLPIRVTGRILVRLEQATGIRSYDYHDFKSAAARSVAAIIPPSLDLSQLPTGTKDDRDLRAVVAIWLAARTTPLAAPRPATPYHGDLDALQRRRTAGHLKMDDPWVGALLMCLPPLRELAADPSIDDDVVAFLTGGAIPKTSRAHRLSGYQLEVTCLAAVAARQSGSRDDFDRQMGLYAHGRPGLYRSSYQRRVDTLVSEECGLKRTLIEQSRIFLATATDPERLSQLRWRRAGRRAARLVYSLTRVGMANPATGSAYPAG